MNKSQAIKMAFAGALMSFGVDLGEQINSRLPTKRRVKDPENAYDKMLKKVAELKRELKVLKRVPRDERDFSRIEEIKNKIKGIRDECK